MKLTYDSSGRMNYNPQIHFNQGTRWTNDDLEYLIEWYDKVGVEEMSFALGRTEKTIFHKVYQLRKVGLMGKSNTNERHKRVIR